MRSEEDLTLSKLTIIVFESRRDYRFFFRHSQFYSSQKESKYTRVSHKLTSAIYNIIYLRNIIENRKRQARVY